jgi:hypothetical protein
MSLLALTGFLHWTAAGAVMLVIATTVSVADNGLAFTSVAEAAGPAWSGKALGIQNTGQFLAASAVGPGVGALIGAVGYPLAFALVALAPLVSIPLVPTCDAVAAENLSLESRWADASAAFPGRLLASTKVGQVQHEAVAYVTLMATLLRQQRGPARRRHRRPRGTHYRRSVSEVADDRGTFHPRFRRRNFAIRALERKLGVRLSPQEVMDLFSVNENVARQSPHAQWEANGDADLE